MTASGGDYVELRACRSGLMAFNRNDVYIGGSLRKYGEYSWLEVELLRQVVRPGATIVEAGANVGAHTVELSRMAGAGGTVLAFEPQRSVFELLQRNLRLNACDNVRASLAALGAEAGEIEVPYYDPGLTGNFGAVALRSGVPGERVPLTAIDALGLQACHLVKADVEGMEAEVLRGAAATVARCRPVLYLENHAEDERSRELIALVMELGYDPYWHIPPLYNPENFACDPENIFPDIVSVNLLCLPSEAHAVIGGALRRVKSPQERWQDSM